MQHRIVTYSARETWDAGFALGAILAAGDVVGLIGGLGAGKTTFTQGLASGLGIGEDIVVNSPTFTVLAEHPEGRVPLYHFDVYRLAGPDDLTGIGFDDYLDGSGVVVIEWADRVAGALSEDVLMVTLTEVADGAQDNATREITFAATGLRSVDVVACLAGNGRET
ncbi:MAG: tRNA (adenosine(37)-N6)-threonylcarbamoyltransferase complex ATPase subunit type 1 TsaE [Capsulimonadaceae bacterium]